MLGDNPQQVKEASMFRAVYPVLDTGESTGEKTGKALMRDCEDKFVDYSSRQFLEKA